MPLSITYIQNNVMDEYEIEGWMDITVHGLIDDGIDISERCTTPGRELVGPKGLCIKSIETKADSQEEYRQKYYASGRCISITGSSFITFDQTLNLP
ncbi:MAG: hypothetical protein QF415_14785 [Candidatus Undinarchaeales archaeon]|jgi:hypothetical protein|nr:hypothetical protein [Candidatus Undinarchaeales archaeon]MDP7493775.1 hypothetical protein [Candidatus Undinarchaeales archaeon]